MEKKAKKEKKVGRPAKATKATKKEKVEKVTKAKKSTKVAAKPAKAVKAPAKAAKAPKAVKAPKAKAPKALKAEKATKAAKTPKATKAAKAVKATKTKVAKKVKAVKAEKVKKVVRRKVSTRQLILDTAGELFADYGMKGTSIKMIADQSKQNIAAANYHFGSKKNLYIDTIKHVVEKLSENSDLSQAKINGKNFEAELEKFVKSRAKLLLSGANPPWYGSLIVRALQEAPKNVQEMALEFFRPEVEFLENMAKAVKAKIKPIEAKMWAYTVISQIIFYVFARRMILLAIGKKSYSADFIDEVANHIVHSGKVALKN